jgi:hypothetical protein
LAIEDFVMRELATKKDLQETLHRLTVRLGAIVVVATGLTVGIVALLIVDYFPPELTGRANGALNVLHFG